MYTEEELDELFQKVEDNFKAFCTYGILMFLGVLGTVLALVSFA